MNKFFKIVVLMLLALPSVAIAQEVAKADSTLYNHSLRRQNRGVANIRTEFVPKGQWVFGGSVSYSTHTNNNYTFLIVEDIESNGYQFKITPLVGYAYSKNALVGVRFGYSRGLTELDKASLSITSLDTPIMSRLCGATTFHSAGITSASPSLPRWAWQWVARSRSWPQAHSRA